MANIIYGTIRECIGDDLAILRVRSYALDNTFDFGNKDELTIKFSNINMNCSIKDLLGESLEIIISENSNNPNGIFNGSGKVMRIISSEIFYI
ncbi:hypothetical protein [Flavobacterium ovatum]|uniref:hypothetical protein n=1 Tax=Flavobacterium ovatum TaxID=1928857 RepID=UPI0034509F1A